MEDVPPPKSRNKPRKKNTGHRKVRTHCQEMQETRTHCKRKAKGISQLGPQVTEAWNPHLKAYSESAGRVEDGERMWSVRGETGAQGSAHTVVNK